MKMKELLMYLLGKKAGKAEVILDGTGYTYTDDGSGNIVIKEA